MKLATTVPAVPRVTPFASATAVPPGAPKRPFAQGPGDIRNDGASKMPRSMSAGQVAEQERPLAIRTRLAIEELQRLLSIEAPLEAMLPAVCEIASLVGGVDPQARALLERWTSGQTLEAGERALLNAELGRAIDQSGLFEKVIPAGQPWAPGR